MDHSTDTHSNSTNWLLAFMAGIFRLCSTLTVSEVGAFIFWALSIVSISLMIIINYPKAKAVLKGKKTDDK